MLSQGSVRGPIIETRKPNICGLPRPFLSLALSFDSLAFRTDNNWCSPLKHRSSGGKYADSPTGAIEATKIWRPKAGGGAVQNMIPVGLALTRPVLLAFARAKMRLACLTNSRSASAVQTAPKEFEDSSFQPYRLLVF